jgi:hypothetical protein
LLSIAHPRATVRIRRAAAAASTGTVPIATVASLRARRGRAGSPVPRVERGSRRRRGPLLRLLRLRLQLLLLGRARVRRRLLPRRDKRSVDSLHDGRWSSSGGTGLRLLGCPICWIRRRRRPAGSVHWRQLRRLELLLRSQRGACKGVLSSRDRRSSGRHLLLLLRIGCRRRKRRCSRAGRSRVHCPIA